MKIKKRYIALISLASVGLLFGSLVYCGIKAFPELLEEEEEVKETKHHRLVVETYVNQPANNAPAVVVVSDGPSTGGNFEGFVPNSYEGEVIVSFVKTSSNKNNNSHFKTTIKTSEEHLDSPTTSFVDKPIITISEEPQIKTDVSINSDSRYYGSSYQNKNNNIVLNNNSTNKAINIPVASQYSANKEIVECSLLVIGAVDLISVLLISHRKRKLFC